ncbi:HAD family hydrolase [Streptomyces sp. NPDC059788]|uniref:HAD family hydrolase n=1 Tax=Streptomyces sp. NPDC059788 TaxID=3346948 RepID=UPI003666D73A
MDGNGLFPDSGSDRVKAGGPGWRPEVLVLDIDGTLVEPGREMTDRVRAALRHASAAGCHVVLATGRASFEVTELFRSTGLRQGLAVCSNGAVVAHMPSGEILAQETFDAQPVLDAVLKHVPAARVAVEIAGTGYLVTHKFPAEKLLGPQIVAPLDGLCTEPVIRAVIRDPSQTSEDFRTLTQKLRIRGASYAVGFEAWLDLGPLGVSKASGLEKVTSMLDTDHRRALAIGDGDNDAEMLAWAGHGVAMGHAPAKLKQIADATTLTVGEDGVAAEIEKWFCA